MQYKCLFDLTIFHTEIFFSRPIVIFYPSATVFAEELEKFNILESHIICLGWKHSQGKSITKLLMEKQKNKNNDDDKQVKWSVGRIKSKWRGTIEINVKIIDCRSKGKSCNIYFENKCSSPVEKFLYQRAPKARYLFGAPLLKTYSKTIHRIICINIY